MTQLISINNAKKHHAKKHQLSVEVRINENTLRRKVINVNQDCH